MKRKGIIFDLDGTLWDSAQSVADSWNEVLRECDDIDYEMTVEKMHGYMGMPMDQIAKDFFYNVSEERAMELLEMCSEYENAYIYEHGGNLFEGVRDVLKKLRKEYIIGIVSNCQQGYIEAFLQHFDMSYIVEDYIDFGTTGRTKAKNIEQMIENHSILEAWYVGDTKGDFLAARKAGAKFIHAAYGFGEVPEAKKKIHSFSELLDIFPIEDPEKYVIPYKAKEKKERPKTCKKNCLCNPEASEEAKSVYRLLRKKCGKAIMTGQHTQTNAMEELEYVHAVTGYYPKIVGFELLSYSGNINLEGASQECCIEVLENRRTLMKAIELAETTDSIITMCFHWFSPIGGHDKSFYTKNTDFDCRKVLEDSEERVAFYNDLSIIARELEKLKVRNIPVLWRPFHEVEGDWFWWGAHGGEVAAKLYRMMFDYFTKVHKLDNLIWVWSSPTKESYPGDNYVDVIGWDIYLENKEKTDYKKQYEELIKNTSAKKVLAITEVGYNPDIEMLKESKVPWSYFMTWSKEFCIGEKYNTVEELRTLYKSNYAIKEK